MLAFVIADEAVQDSAEAYRYYELIDPRLAERFYGNLLRRFETIERNPEMFGREWRSVRAVTVHKYPYVIYYRITRLRVVVVFAIRHGRENPAVWRRRYRG